MSTILKYLEKYEERGNEIIFYLKDFPSSRMAGNKLVRELYIYLFQETSLQLNRVHKIDDLTYKVEKMQQYRCLNCESPIFFEEASNYITTCEKCNWRNELNDTPALSPITIKTKTFEDYSPQICYPMLDKSLLQYLPEKLREAVEAYFKTPNNFTKEMYQNIYHNIYKKDNSKLSARIKRLSAKKKLAEFFQNTNFLT